MYHWKKMMFLLLLLPIAGCVTGSGESAELRQLAAQAATMEKADLEAVIARYKQMISDKGNVAEMLKAKLKDLPVAEIMGEKGQALKSELSDTMTLIGQLKEKLAVYTDALKAFKK